MLILLPARNEHVTYGMPTNIRCSERADIRPIRRPVAGAIHRGSSLPARVRGRWGWRRKDAWSPASLALPKEEAHPRNRRSAIRIRSGPGSYGAWPSLVGQKT